MAAFEAAQSVASFASLDFVGGAAHAAAAGMFGAMAGGAFGGGTGARGGGSASAPATSGAGAGITGGGSSGTGAGGPRTTIVNVGGGGMVLGTSQELARAIAAQMHGARGTGHRAAA